MDKAKGIEIGEVLAGRRTEARVMLSEVAGAAYRAFTGLFRARAVVDTDAAAPTVVSPGLSSIIATVWPYGANSIRYRNTVAQAFVAERRMVANFTDAMHLMSRSPTVDAGDVSELPSMFVTYQDFLQGLYQGYHGQDRAPEELLHAIALSDEESVKQDPLKYYFSMLLVVKRLNLSPDHFPIGGVLNKTRALARRFFDSIVSSPQTQAVIAPILNNPEMLHHLVRLDSAINAYCVEKIVNGTELVAGDDLITNIYLFNQSLNAVLPNNPISGWLSTASATDCNMFWRVVSNGMPKILGADDPVIATLETAALVKRLPACFRTGDAPVHINRIMSLLADVMPVGNNRENIRAIHSGYVSLFQDEQRNGYAALFEGLEPIDINTIEAMINAQNAFNGVKPEWIDLEMLEFHQAVTSYESLPEGFKGMALCLRDVPRDQLKGLLNLLGQAIPGFKEGSPLHANLMLATNVAISSSTSDNQVTMLQQMIKRGLGPDAFKVLEANPSTKGIADAIKPLLQQDDGSAPLKAYIECLAQPWDERDGKIPLKTFESMIGAAWVYAQANDEEKKHFINLSDQVVNFAKGGNSNQSGALVSIATNLQRVTKDLPRSLIEQAILLVPPPVSKWKSFKTALSYLYQAFTHDEDQAKMRLGGIVFLILMFVFALSAALLPFIVALSLAGVLIVTSVVLGFQYLYKAYRISSNAVSVHSKIQDYVFENILGITDVDVKNDFYQLLKLRASNKDESANADSDSLHEFLKAQYKEQEVSITIEQRILLASYALARGFAGESEACALLSDQEGEDEDLKAYYKTCYQKAAELKESILTARVDLKVVGVPLLGKLMRGIPKGEHSVFEHITRAEEFLYNWKQGGVAEPIKPGEAYIEDVSNSPKPS